METIHQNKNTNVGAKKLYFVGWIRHRNRKCRLCLTVWFHRRLSILALVICLIAKVRLFANFTSVRSKILIRTFICFVVLSKASPEILNWMIHVKYIRKEFDQCKKLAEEELKRSNGYSEYANYILVMKLINIWCGLLKRCVGCLRVQSKGVILHLCVLRMKTNKLPNSIKVGVDTSA